MALLLNQVSKIKLKIIYINTFNIINDGYVFREYYYITTKVLLLLNNNLNNLEFNNSYTISLMLRVCTTAD